MSKQLLYILPKLELLSSTPCTNKNSPIKNKMNDNIRVIVVDTTNVEMPAKASRYCNEEDIK